MESEPKPFLNYLTQADAAAQMWGGIPVHNNPFVPKGTAFLINGDSLFISIPVKRCRFWYKPWTWLRKNRNLTLEEMWGDSGRWMQ